MKMRHALYASCLSVVGASSALAACPPSTTSAAALAGKETCILKGTYTSDLSLTSDKNWILSGGVFVGGDNANNATLSIQPGTKIYGQSGPDFLVINRGSKIMAQGTKTDPIVFTTLKTVTGEPRVRGSWGGLVLNGNAPINRCDGSAAVCETDGEGGTGKFGGSNATDSSGVLRYVRVEFSGYEVSPDNEINGITLNGVGSGTVVDFVQVHMNQDDGMEMFGGTVNVKHVMLSSNRDDSLDWDLGWRGKAQFLLIKQAGDEGNNGIEADNNASPHNASPRSFPELSNVTLVGASTTANGDMGILLRRGTGAIIQNSIITGFKNACLDLDDNSTFENAEAAEGIEFFNVIADCGGKEFSVEATDPFSVKDYFLGFEGSLVAAPKLAGFVPAAGSPALVGEDVTPLNAFFDEVDFIGAVRDEAGDWTKGWTTDAAQ